MRNPLKSYYFIGFEKSNNGVTVSKHFKMFSAWFWVKPAKLLHEIEQNLCMQLNCKKSDLFPVSFNKN